MTYHLSQMGDRSPSPIRGFMRSRFATSHKGVPPVGLYSVNLSNDRIYLGELTMEYTSVHYGL